MKDITKQHRGCCFFPFPLCCYYCDRYQISKAAKFMAKHIQDELISKCPQNSITLRITPEHLKPIPTSFLKGLESRTRLLDQLLEKLNDDKVDTVGVCGMGGAGKTTLVKEIMKTVKNTFSKKAIVEVSDVPDIVRIQNAIAESISLNLKGVNDVGQRAHRLYNRLISEKKVLIILDNIWKELNLVEIGIPRVCKLLLTTREKAVCRVMGVQDVNIITVGLMDTDESRELFKSHTGNQVVVAKYRNVVQRLLSKCGGLPLSIVATASSLKDKDLYSWEKFADDLEKPISSQVTSDYRRTYSVLETSYNFIEENEKKIFFLLASLSPFVSSISIESLTRYGIGLNLFEHVNKLSEAIEKGVTWANELKLSSMLIEGDVKGDVKMHDIVRAFAISYAAKEEQHTFMVDGIPRWLDDVTLKKYTAISLTSKNDYSRLSGIQCHKLQILVLKGDLSPNFDESFFNGMVNLEVLALSNMDFQPSLPKSMGKLQKLRTLSMERCKLGTIELVGELVNLLVLSLRESFVEKLSNEFENLRKLRLLDLRECTSSKLPLIPIDVLSALSTLEGLYLYNNRQSVFEKESDYEGANSTENNWLPYLNALEIKVAEELPIDGQFIKSLDKFRISVGNCNLTPDILQRFSCILSIDRIGDVSAFLKKSWFKVLLKKSDLLDMSFNYTFEDLAPKLDQEGFKSLRYLRLFSCDDVKCIVNGRMMNNLIAFPRLQSLKLEHLIRLKTVCCGDVPPGTFSNLQTIQLHYLDELRYGLPLIPRDVYEISVFSCKLLKFMFIKEEENNEELSAIELPLLKTLHFCEVPRLLSLVRPKMFIDNNDAQQQSRFFFDGKIVLPSLELLVLSQCNDVVELWSKEIRAPGFQNLKEIKIANCGKLSSVGSPSVFSTLVQLETLSITACEKMQEVVSVEETKELKNGGQIIRFPSLKYLKLGDLN